MHVARLQGDAYAQAVSYLLAEASGAGAEGRAGGYRIGYVALGAGRGDPPEGGSGRTDSDVRIIRLGVIVRDAADGRFVPGLQVVVSILEPGGTEVGCHDHPLMWHP